MKELMYSYSVLSCQDKPVVSKIKSKGNKPATVEIVEDTELNFLMYILL